MSQKKQTCEWLVIICVRMHTSILMYTCAFIKLCYINIDEGPFLYWINFGVGFFGWFLAARLYWRFGNGWVYPLVIVQVGVWDKVWRHATFRLKESSRQIEIGGGKRVRNDAKKREFTLNGVGSPHVTLTKPEGEKAFRTIATLFVSPNPESWRSPTFRCQWRQEPKDRRNQCTEIEFKCLIILFNSALPVNSFMAHEYTHLYNPLRSWLDCPAAISVSLRFFLPSY